MRKGRDGGKKRGKRVTVEIVASNVVASRPPNGDRLQHRPLVPIMEPMQEVVCMIDYGMGTSFLMHFILECVT